MGFSSAIFFNFFLVFPSFCYWLYVLDNSLKEIDHSFDRYGNILVVCI